MPNWEYKLEINLGEQNAEIGAPDTTEVLNDLGADGWELVSVVEVTTKTGGHNMAFYFKRPVGEHA